MSESHMINRYARQIVLNDIGIEGQRKLAESSVLIVGAGGLGSPAAIYLAAAGIGEIGIIDGDKIDESNLQRQILFETNHIGEFKADITKDKLLRMNPTINVVSYNEYISTQNAEKYISEYDVIINGTDNYPTRYLVNDTCVKLNKVLIDASGVMFEGQITTYIPGQGCYRCLYPHAPKGMDVLNCRSAGVIGPVVGVLGVLQAMEAIKVILNIGEYLDTRLLHYNALTSDFYLLMKQKDPACICCGEFRNEHLLAEEYEEVCESRMSEVSYDQIEKWRQTQGVLLVDIRDKQSFHVMHIPSSIRVDSQDLMKFIDEDIKTVLICQEGLLSKEMLMDLTLASYPNMFSLKGGINEWLLEEWKN
ncbi:ThiF family adenylyltransferase [Lysinibacillus sp. NPDC093688]|uniref:ThiF family adenylyltransferase n=1 Tax=Lysinibacillus sp. NPDC093688 TaxID=3390577 RepID=UPI003D0801BC